MRKINMVIVAAVTHQIMLLENLTWANETHRCMPTYGYVDDVTIDSDDTHHDVFVCFEFITSAPTFDENYFLFTQSEDLFAEVDDINYHNHTGIPVSGPQAEGIRLDFEANGQNIYALVNSDGYIIKPLQLNFFLSFIRTNNNKNPREVLAVSHHTTFDNLYIPQFERVRYCEKSRFEAAYDPSYIRALFQNPFIIGYIQGACNYQFRFKAPFYFGDIHLGSSTTHLSMYRAPIFGDPSTISILEIRAAQFFNTMLFLEEQVDLTKLNEYRSRNADLIAELEAHFQVSVPNPITMESVIQFFLDIRS